jgi:hypothetical protein
MGTQSSLEAIAPSASTFASQGQLGVIGLALLSIIFWLLIRDFLKDRLIWRMVEADKESDKATGDAIRTFAVQLSRVESAVGVREVQRMIEKGELPTGALPETRE